MKSRMQRCGRSLVLRIPPSIGHKLGLTEGSEVELISENGRLAMIPVTASQRLSLRQLLARITDRNIHQEVWIGRSRGRESW